MNDIILLTVDFVKRQLKNAEGGHDWFHIERVWKNAEAISKGESCDAEIVALAALLHDIADSKFHGGDETVGPATARNWLVSNGYSETKLEHIIAIIQNVSFKGGTVARTHESIELDIVQDADRLDAIGAIGIARTFNYGGYKHRAIYDPEIEPNLNLSKEDYKASTAPTINHFYEKLLLLKDRMNTKTGRELALERHRFMESFLDQFYAEWNGLR
ncbi:MAG: HD domain-containing protein [Bacteroidetes bacterium]|nr:HD domain-containing protein [Bacteroidota bacterium]MDA0898745.1 HD domain-containing protein [Bacteroidota bacterium]